MQARRRHLVLAGGLAAVGAVGGAATIAPRWLWGDRADYSGVVSIRATAAFQDATLLERAWALPVAARLRPHIEYQRNPSFCGPASLLNVMRSHGQLLAQQDRMLDGSGIFSLFGLIPGGLSLDELARLAQLRLGSGVIVTALHGPDLKTFRQHLARVNDPGRRYIANFARGPLFGSGSGHHSPLAGYLVDEDLVLVLDVNRAFGPWLVRSQRLHAAIDTIDPTTSRARGLLLMECAAPSCQIQ